MHSTVPMLLWGRSLGCPLPTRRRRSTAAPTPFVHRLIDRLQYRVEKATPLLEDGAPPALLDQPKAQAALAHSALH